MCHNELTAKSLVFCKSGRLGEMVIPGGSNVYILLDGLVCSIVGYFYESRCILVSP